MSRSWMLALAMLAGCSVEPALREQVDAIDDAWRVYRDGVVAAPGITPEEHSRRTASMDRGIETARRAAHAE